MPYYDYLDKNGHQVEIYHGMNSTAIIRCERCGLVMWRRPPSIAGVIWGGLAPSQGEVPGFIAEHISRASENRDNNDKKYSSKKEVNGITEYAIEG